MNSDYITNQEYMAHFSQLDQITDPFDPVLGDKRDLDDDQVVKKAGRRKIQIEYIEEKSRRHITFSKRKAGIMKKAYELSTLTGTQVLLLVASETGHVYTFATPKLQPIITQPEGKNLIQACLNSQQDQPPNSQPFSPQPSNPYLNSPMPQRPLSSLSQPFQTDSTENNDDQRFYQQPQYYDHQDHFNPYSQQFNSSFLNNQGRDSPLQHMRTDSSMLNSSLPLHQPSAMRPGDLHSSSNPVIRPESVPIQSAVTSSVFPGNSAQSSILRSHSPVSIMRSQTASPAAMLRRGSELAQLNHSINANSTEQHNQGVDGGTTGDSEKATKNFNTMNPSDLHSSSNLNNKEE